MIVRIALLLLALPLLAHGAEGLYNAARSRKPATISCEQFTRERPATTWVRLSGCDVDYVRAAYRERAGRITEFFFPLRASGSAPDQPSAIVVSTSDPFVLDIAQPMLAGGRQPDREAFLVMMLRIVTAMGATREVEGTTRSSLDMLRTRRDLATIKASLHDDYAVLDLRRRPNPLFPALETAAGVLALLAAGYAMRRQRGGEAVPADAVNMVAAPAPADGADAPAAPIGDPRPAGRPELRRLMLLNLPPHPAPADVEMAPPLGTQEAVRAALAKVLTDVRIGEDGIAEFNRPDHQLRLDLGTVAVVATIVADVTGDGAGIALRRLVTQTGWQAYAPRLGRFLTVDDLS